MSAPSEAAVAPAWLAGRLPTEAAAIWGRFIARLSAAAPAIGAYIGLRALSLSVLTVLVRSGVQREPSRMVYWDGSHNRWRGYRSILDVLLSWDGRWYVKIAEYGYTSNTSGNDEYGIPYIHRVAFLPLYPYLSRSLTLLPGVDAVAACLVVSLVSAIAAAWALFAIGSLLQGPRLGVILAALWAVVPVCMTQNGAFTESLFTAVCAWALYAVLTRRWVLAGLLTVLAGLTRPTAPALVLTVGLAALVAAVRRQDGWRPYVAAGLAPLGFAAYVVGASNRLGGLDRYTELQRNIWASWFDYGQHSMESLGSILLGRESWNGQIFVFSALIILGAAVSLGAAALQRMHWVLVVFAAVLFLGCLGSHAHITQMGRHLLPAFPILLVPAVALARARTSTVVMVLCFLGLASGWYGCWLPFASGHAI